MTASEAQRTARERAWVDMLAVVRPAMGDRAFAIGDACAAAVHYGACYEGMGEFAFALLREDFDERRGDIAAAARAAGYKVKDVVWAGERRFERPYLSIGACVADGADGKGVWAWLDVYPLDTIPVQVTLRFKVFKQAARAMSDFRDMEAAGAFGGMPAFEADMVRARRYDGAATGLRSNLCGRGKARRMGERTVFQRTIEEDGLFPVRELPFAGATVPVARDVSNWTLEMTPQRRRVVERIQGESLESLEAIDRACEQLGITYFLVGGSMLGAVRDGGFIPWDDDTDVGMLRRDYRRFCRKANRVLGGQGYFLQLPRTDRHIHFVYARLRKDGIQYITHYNQDKRFHRGIWVDLFPFDARPKNEAAAKVQRFLANGFARASMAFKRRREYVEADMLTDLTHLPEEDLRYLRRYRTAARFFPVTLCRWAYNVCARFFNPFLAGKEGTLYASFVPTYTTIAQEEVFPVRKVPFEDTELCVPAGADAFLARQYGDYLREPPSHERYAEHGFKCLLDADGRMVG